MDITSFLLNISKQYQLNPNGVHGLSHWGRVLENGRRLAEVEGGDQTVITLFAIFHDACRHNQSIDPGHGARGAVLAEQLLKYYPDVSSIQLDLLKTACNHHTDGFIEGDITVQICWDADRLDLFRVGIRPKARYLCTDAAKDQKLISWANSRAATDHTPNFVIDKWSELFQA